MSENVLSPSRIQAFERLPSSLIGLIRRQLLRELARIQWGQIEIIEQDERCTVIGSGNTEGPRTRVWVRDPAMFAYVGLGGSAGAGLSYFLGLWDTSSLTDLVRIMVHNRYVLDALDEGWTWPSKLLYNYVHWRRQNSKTKSKSNIAAHYDLGDDFFELMLDPTMMYSAAVFTRPDMTLEEAQIEKLDLICRKLDLVPGDHLLEIGTGWGGLAAHAAAHYGCRVTTTTISENQFRYAAARIQSLGLAERVTVLKRDYRELVGKYDKLVSIEMVEAVGHQYFDTFFGKVGALLSDDGLALIQAITIEDSRFEQYKRTPDYIKRFIFPGGCLPSINAMLNSTTRMTDLVLVHLEDIGHHYATTLKLWWENCIARQPQIEALGYPQTFLRMWQFYLSYCEGGFIERSIGDAQMLLARPGWRARR